MAANLRSTLSVLLLSAGPALAQSAVPVFEPFTRDFDAAVFVTGGQALAIDQESLRAMPAEGETLIASFPIAAKQSVDLLVHRINPRATETRFVVIV